VAEPLRTNPFGWHGLFLAAFALVMFLRLLPVTGGAGGVPMPDVMLCLTFAWVVRRPDHLPAMLIAVVFLLEDFLLMRPPGLWAALVVLGAEFLRSRAALSRELPFPGEWLMVAVVMTAVILGDRAISFVTLLPVAALGSTLILLVGTVVAYPVVVGLAAATLGLRKPATGELDALGRRL